MVFWSSNTEAKTWYFEEDVRIFEAKKLERDSRIENESP